MSEPADTSQPDAQDDAWPDPYDSGSRREVAALVMLLLATAAAFFPALSADFLWRDDVAVTRNDALRSLATLGWSFAHPRAVPVYRPVADAFLWPQYTLWRDWNPGGYHLVSLLLHLANVTLFWLVLRRLRVPAAVAGAALFALHPIAVQPVAWIAQQPVLIATMFALLATLAFLRLAHIDPPPPEAEGGWNLSRRRWLMMTMVAGFQSMALLADARIACGVPVALAALAWWKERGHERAITSALAAISLAVALFVAWAAQSRASTVAPGAVEWVSLTARGVGFHVAKLAAPYPLLLSYSRVPAWTWLGLGVVVAALAALGSMRDRIGRGPATAVAVFAALLVPALLFQDTPPADGGFVADHQSYLARASLLALAAAALLRFVPEPDEELDRHRMTRPLVLIAVALIAGGFAFQQSEKYRNDVVAWSLVLAHDPGSRLAHEQLAEARLRTRDFDGAVAQLRALIELNPADADAQLRLGEVYSRQGKPDEAEAYFQQAARLRPSDSSAWRHLGATAAQRNDLATAESHYRRALSIDATDDMARNNLATLLARRNKVDEAMAEYDRALQHNPHSTAAHLNLANLLFATGNVDEAANHLQEAVRIDPRNFDAYMTAGGILMNFKEFHQAARMFREAVRIDRNAAQAYNALGVALAAQGPGQLSDAIYNFGRAVDLDPKLESARRNLAEAKAQRDGTTPPPPATTRSA